MYPFKSFTVSGVLTLIVFSPIRSPAASFTSVPFLNGNDYESRAMAVAVSNDVVFVAGGCTDDNFNEQAVRWTVPGGVQGIGFLSGDFDSIAFGISTNGQLLVGRSGSRAYRWSTPDGMINLGGLVGKDYHVAWDVSGDGSMVVGSGDVGGDEEFVRPFRWTAQDGMIGLGFLPGHTRGEALAISNDGTLDVPSPWTPACTCELVYYISSPGSFLERSNTFLEGQRELARGVEREWWASSEEQ